MAQRVLMGCPLERFTIGKHLEVLMSTLISVSEVLAIRGMDDAERPLYFNLIAKAKRVTPDEVLKAYTALQESADKHVASEAAREAREKRAKLVDTLRVDVEAFRLGTTMPDSSVHDFSLLSELRNRAVELDSAITFMGIVEGAPRFGLVVTGKATTTAAPTTAASGVRGGGTGAGRPAADAPQAYFDLSLRQRVTGPVTLWLTSKVGAERLGKAGLLKADGKLKASGSGIATLAVKAGILSDLPLDAPLPADAAPVATTASAPA